MHDFSGTEILHYDIFEKLGEGGMGVVYKARDKKLKRDVAIKFLPRHVAANIEERNRFKIEAQAAAALNHPNIATIYAIEELDDEMFIVMEFIPGKELKASIDSMPLPVEECISIATQIASGLEAAHKNGVVHRDVKAANIMSSEDGVVKIMDFGLAKVRGAGQLTKVGTTLGTIAYMAPEQARGEETDHRADIWSFGVVLYEMLTGKLPFDAQYEQATIYAIINEEATPVSREIPDIAPAIERILNRALAKEKEDRFQSATELLDALREIDQSYMSPKTEAASNFSFGRNFWAVTSIVLVLLVLSFLVSQHSPSEISTEDDIKLAVLPFENVGISDNNVFALGISDEILTKLSMIPGLKVIARESSFEYADDSMPLSQLGKELGVQYFVKGSIRWENAEDPDGRIRITPRLVSISDGANVWAGSVDTKLNDMFVSQSEVARQVANALQLEVNSSTKSRFGTNTPQNIEAHKFLLRHKELARSARSNQKDVMLLGVQLINEAIRIDSSYAEALAWKSLSHSKLFWHGFNRSDSNAAEARTSFEKALAFDPNLPMGHVAKGFYYYFVLRDYFTSQTVFEHALSLNSNDWLATYSLALINRRLGNLGVSQKLMRDAVELNPRYPLPATNLGLLYKQTRQFDQAEKVFKSIISQWPEFTAGHANLAELYISWQGDTEKARAVLEAAPDGLPSGALNGSWVRVHLLEGNFEQAIQRASVPPLDSLQYFISNATSRFYASRTDEARNFADSARVILEQKLVETPNSEKWHQALGHIYAILGRKEEAIRTARKAVALLPIKKDAASGPSYVQTLAFVYAQVGEHDAAIEQLELLLSIPSNFTIHHLKLEPEWKSLRELDRAKNLISKFED